MIQKRQDHDRALPWDSLSDDTVSGLVQQQKFSQRVKNKDARRENRQTCLRHVFDRDFHINFLQPVQSVYEVVELLRQKGADSSNPEALAWALREYLGASPSTLAPTPFLYKDFASILDAQSWKMDVAKDPEGATSISRGDGGGKAPARTNSAEEDNGDEDVKTKRRGVFVDLVQPISLEGAELLAAMSLGGNYAADGAAGASEETKPQLSGLPRATIEKRRCQSELKRRARFRSLRLPAALTDLKEDFEREHLKSTKAFQDFRAREELKFPGEFTPSLETFRAFYPASGEDDHVGGAVISSSSAIMSSSQQVSTAGVSSGEPHVVDPVDATPATPEETKAPGGTKGKQKQKRLKKKLNAGSVEARPGRVVHPPRKPRVLSGDDRDGPNLSFARFSAASVALGAIPVPAGKTVSCASDASDEIGASAGGSYLVGRVTRMALSGVAGVEQAAAVIDGPLDPLPLAVVRGSLATFATAALSAMGRYLQLAFPLLVGEEAEDHSSSADTEQSSAAGKNRATKLNARARLEAVRSRVFFLFPSVFSYYMYHAATFNVYTSSRRRAVMFRVRVHVHIFRTHLCASFHASLTRSALGVGAKVDAL